MPPQLRIHSVSFISPQNHPILIRIFAKKNGLKYHYIAHTSLDVIDERVTAAAKPSDCYLGLLYTMEDVSVYGYITPLKVKIILTLALADGVVKDMEVINIFKALHMAYYAAASNPFLKHNSSLDAANDASTLHLVGSMKWKGFRRRVDRIAEIVGTVEPTAVN